MQTIGRFVFVSVINYEHLKLSLYIYIILAIHLMLPEWTKKLLSDSGLFVGYVG